MEMADDTLPDVPFPSTPTPGSNQETPQGQYIQLPRGWPPNSNATRFYNVPQHPSSAPPMLQLLPNQYSMMQGSPGNPMVLPATQYSNLPAGYHMVSQNFPGLQMASNEPLSQVTSTEDNTEVSTRGRGRGRGRGRARGGARGLGKGRGRGKGKSKGVDANAEPKTPKPWDTDAPEGGKSSVERIIDWLTVQGNYALWRGPSQSKKSQAEFIAEWLETKGCTGRNGKGVEQQIARLEKSFRDAMAYRSATGQGMMDSARQLQQLEAGEDQDENAIDHVAVATSKVEARIREICPFYDALEPVMGERPSSAPTYLSEQTEEDREDDITRALGLDDGEGTSDSDNLDVIERQPRRDSPDWDDDPALWDSQETQDTQRSDRRTESSIPAIDNTPQPSQNQRAPNARSGETTAALTPTIESSNSSKKRGSASTASSSPKKKSYAESISDRIFPSKEDMDKDRSDQLSLAKRRADTEDRLVDATASLAKSLTGDHAGPEQQKLAIIKTKLELEITKFEFARRQRNSEKDLVRENLKLDIEVARARAEVEEKKAATRNANALMRANMIQGFMQNTGFTYEAAVKATNDVMGAPPTANESSVEDRM
ncbi:hypothetical protein PGT21_002708 [Puccinia graminis f. sp. tritici]|uniref:Uncharacterized protein n=1 Tax=Puccinia graminis f. sp. tritici TaxID=56615 RepID=A0A5B0ME19_PUCGR|nr:hypothetical protein PGT21_002708 [Puccinia graminis f. sp. tritici]